MDRYGTGPRSFGAACWIPGVKTDKTAKKRRKKRPKWARYSLTKRVRVADLFLMDRYIEDALKPDDIEGYQALRAATTIPLIMQQIPFGHLEMLSVPDPPPLQSATF